MPTSPINCRHGDDLLCDPGAWITDYVPIQPQWVCFPQANNHRYWPETSQNMLPARGNASKKTRVWAYFSHPPLGVLFFPFNLQLNRTQLITRSLGYSCVCQSFQAMSWVNPPQGEKQGCTNIRHGPFMSRSLDLYRTYTYFWWRASPSSWYAMWLWLESACVSLSLCQVAKIVYNNQNVASPNKTAWTRW